MEFRLLLDLVDRALKEDLAWGDATAEGLFDGTLNCELALVFRQEGVVAGLPLAEMVFKHLDPYARFKALVEEGAWAQPGTVIARVQGTARTLVQTERTALNFLQRLCGIATLTRMYVQEARKTNDKVKIADTRKTTPGLRMLEKYAVRTGGGVNHRYCLADMVMIKDNHLALLGQQQISLKDAVAKLRAKQSHALKIQVEVDRLDQVQAVLDSGAEAILLDNMGLEHMTQAVELIQGRMLVEASGGVTLERVGAIAATGVDLISVGALTHSPKSLDIGLDYL
ncbi:MAG: nicotinate-nucleotide diphosphorylase (carboxylating) [Candidatus Lambdaproteobacteria bacterium RIFOXYD1_FULL_56_27]|uniref:Probable nicotinate-nucleotide pyrophosphorylase [carboxylating] n=1 Tax=Candidatus Lambdaproteobacteria bacterium RIFOXYD2_FULL_56_26 TaxID=1817773 RepID=A0A1F6GXA1_9PROT|nr:MAG: nicotinate-nucleotide diphosphorylase (carboxylating) [Candidatus Lambdaproteobacteria bacterium RIFOXYC1_FULL_56_13]OGH02692.1 MAG: nicotinate-nucleotide diphosphorylase (carboxylating) [Candidatus Lambdaproteobacteria bacterium RIFOXYD2_FULL_56_26]OGH07987.1 MAG: nicotinate-nucleotide diphosphorylase (carboxylating) [Candidatus Lambdaproteobacteria bacterium RIFOXYD1_FULL_56_27]